MGRVSIVRRAVVSATVVSLFLFLGLSVFVHLAFLFLLVLPGGVAVYGALEKRTSRLELPSTFCPACAGEWGQWGSISRTSNYMSWDDRSTRYTQVRNCRECGYAESRRVA